AEVKPPTVAQVEAMPDGPEKDLARAALELTATVAASSLSRDRAHGAEVAGDAAWQARQWEAASRWMDRAAALGLRIAQLLRVVRRPLAAARRSGAAVVASLKASGLPAELRDLILGLGWSTEQVDDLTRMLADASPASFEGPPLTADLFSLTAYLDAEVA